MAKKTLNPDNPLHKGQLSTEITPPQNPVDPTNSSAEASNSGIPPETSTVISEPPLDLDDNGEPRGEKIDPALANVLPRAPEPPADLTESKEPLPPPPDKEKDLREARAHLGLSAEPAQIQRGQGRAIAEANHAVHKKPQAVFPPHYNEVMAFIEMIANLENPGPKALLVIAETARHLVREARILDQVKKR